MSEMIERVAKAIYDALDPENPNQYVSAYRYPDGELCPRTTLDGQWDINKIATAAIEAMREPTDEMFAAAATIDHDADPGEEWEPMIDAALGVPRS